MIWTKLEGQRNENKILNSGHNDTLESIKLSFANTYLQLSDSLP